MADIAPFHALHYNPATAGSLDDLVAPPYDVIGPADQDALYDRDPRNCVRIILNRPEPGDAETSTYDRASASLEQWRSRGVLTETPEPALFVYRQTFRSGIDGRPCTRHGVFCALTLARYDEGVVLPHEFTRPKAKADRLQLLRATRCNTEPIMALYEDPELRLLKSLVGHATQGDPLLRACVGDDTHDVWAVTDQQALVAYMAGLADKRVWIADGHHRYETALTYRDELRAAGQDLPGADRIMVVLIPFEEPGLIVLPTHRLLSGLSQRLLGALLARMEEVCTAEEIASDAQVPEILEHMRSSDGGFIAATRSGARLLRLRDPSWMAASAADRSSAWRSLDVAIVQTLLLDRLAGAERDAMVTFSRSADEALHRARHDDGSMALLVGRPSADDVRAVAAAGDRMPAKSTYFDPKLWSGLLMRRLVR